MTSELLSLDLSVRLALFAVCNLVILIWTRFFMAAVKPGVQRCILFLPFFAVTYFITCLFDRENPNEQTLTVYATGTYFCINALKVAAFCFNRGQLAKVLDTNRFAAFTIALLLPVNIEFEEKPIASSKKTDSDDSSPQKKTVFEDVEYSLVTFKGLALLKEIGLVITRFCIKTAVCFVFASISTRTEDFTFAQSAALSWFLCFYLAMLQDANALFGLLTLNIKISANFVAPYLATSVSEFWAKRWNLIMQHLLRDNFYLPVLESKFPVLGFGEVWGLGSFVAVPQRLNRKKTSMIRTVMAMINVFVASALIHGYLMMVFMGSTEFPVYYSAFFVFNAVAVIFEKCLKMLLIKKGYYSGSLSFFQSVILILYTQAVTLTLAHFFFWPDLVRIQFIQPTVDGVLTIGSVCS